MNHSIPAQCPRCGGTLSADSPEGLCPRCLGALPFAPDTFFTGEESAAIHPPLTPEELAPHFPNLEILECLGRGGMGVVYKARQKSLNRLVALKLLAPERANDAAFADRFAREARALAALNHPNIVTIHDFGEAGGFFFLLMEYVDGVNLRRAMQSGRFTPEQALAIVPPICEALQYAHEHGIVHRDIKPENLLLDRESRVKVADFGIAKMLHAEGPDVGLHETQPAGTPQYMAPEQHGERRADHRADIYSLGVVLYEMLTGELPTDHLQPPSRKVKIDVRLDEIVLRALEKSPELRFHTAAEMRTRLETLADEPAKPPVLPIASPAASSGKSTRRVLFIIASIIVGGLLLLCGLAFAVFFARSSAMRNGKRQAERVATSETSASPPALRFLLWQNENPNPVAPPLAWHPDGSPVTTEPELESLRINHRIQSMVEDGPDGPKPILRLLFSHRDIDAVSFSQITLLDGNGKKLTGKSSVTSTFTGKRKGSDMGWINYQVLMEEIPESIRVKLIYGIGPWLDGQEVPTNSEGGISLGSRVTLGKPGETMDNAVISLTRRDMESPDNQYVFVAVMKDGRILNGGAMTNAFGPEETIQTFNFSAKLAEIRCFRLRTRPVRLIEFDNVRLRTPKMVQSGPRNVRILENGTFEINHVILGLPEFVNWLRKLKAATDDQATVIFRTDADVSYARVQAALSACAESGISNVSFATAEKPER